MKKVHKLLMIGCMLVTISCSNGQNSDNQSVANLSDDNAMNPKTDTPVAQDQQKYFGVKCGYVKYITNAAGQELIREWWFDDFGKKQYEENYLIINGEQSGDKALIMDGIQYSWSFDATIGTKRNYYHTMTDYDQISQKTIDRYGIEKQGFEDILGKKCLKVSTEKPSKSTSWVWENIVLKTKAEFGGQQVIMEASELNINQPPASLFELPSGVSFGE